MLKCPFPLELAIITVRRKSNFTVGIWNLDESGFWMFKKRLGLDFEWDLKSRSPTIWNPDKWLPFCQKRLKSRQKRPDSECSSFQMFGTTAIAVAKAQPFENQSIRNLTFKKVGISNVSGFWMVRFQIPTVHETVNSFSCQQKFFFETNTTRSLFPWWTMFSVADAIYPPF